MARCSAKPAKMQPISPVLMRDCRPSRFSVQPFLRALCCKACRPGFSPALVRPADERVGRAWKETMLLPNKDRRRRVVDKEDPGAAWQLPTHLPAVMAHLDVDRPPSSA